MPQDKRDLGDQTLEGTIGGWGEEVAEDESDRTNKQSATEEDRTPSPGKDPGN